LIKVQYLFFDFLEFLVKCILPIPYPLPGSKTRKLPNNTGSNFKPLLTLLERRRRSQE
jgi:hypothetical protein